MFTTSFSKEQLIQRLKPPQGKVRVVIDTDTYNEVDDQFALAYALLSPEKIEVEAAYTAPFSSAFFAKLLNTGNVPIPMKSDLREGLELSYREIIKIYDLLNIPSMGKVFRGSDQYMFAPDAPIESDAAHDLVRRAMASEKFLYVVAIGEVTNIASAILIEPKIVNKLVVVWLGGQPLYWPQTIEFNLGQDIFASQLLLNSGVPLVIIPCMSVASHLTTTAAELDVEINGKSKIGSYLAEIVVNQLSQEAAAGMLHTLKSTYLRGACDYDSDIAAIETSSPMACSRIVWDISAIGYMINPNWCPTTLVPAPYLQDDMTWKHDESRHLMRICNFIYRDAIFGDMFAKLRGADR
jgi:hypothetical protein